MSRRHALLALAGLGLGVAGRAEDAEPAARPPAAATFSTLGPPVQSGYADVGPLRMYFERRGEGPPLLLLHGGGSSIATTFGRVIDDLARRHRVIAVEQQGHGHTADVDRPFRFEQMADDTAALLDSLGAGPLDVLGFSNGGNVALQLAMRHPRRVRRLIVASTFYRRDGLDPKVLASFSKPVDLSAMPPALRDDYLRVAPRPGDLAKQAGKLMQLMGGFRDWPASALQGIVAPTLVVVGDQDIVRPEHAAAMSRLLPHGRLLVLPGPHGALLGEASAPPSDGALPRISVELFERFLAAPEKV